MVVYGSAWFKAREQLMKAVADGKVEKDATIMLNITGAGEARFKSEHEVYKLEPSKIFPLNAEADEVIAAVESLFSANDNE